MERFNKKGVLITPNPIGGVAGAKKLFVVKELFCSNGHNLISARAIFNGYPGIMIKARKENRQGLVALSPIYGSKVRVAMDIDLIDKEITDFHCPICDAKFPVYSTCACGADLVAFFCTQDGTFSDCIGICNRVNCINSRVIINDELICQSMADVF